jgi:hypothetical protein
MAASEAGKVASMSVGSMFANAGLSILLFMSFLGFVYGIIMNKRKSEALEQQRVAIVGYHKKAEDLLARARNIATIASIEQPFAVCDSCGMIRSRYVNDEGGITCIECAEKHTDRN